MSQFHYVICSAVLLCLFSLSQCALDGKYKTVCTCSEKVCSIAPLSGTVVLYATGDGRVYRTGNDTDLVTVRVATAAQSASLAYSALGVACYGVWDDIAECVTLTSCSVNGSEVCTGGSSLSLIKSNAPASLASLALVIALALIATLWSL
eukprot:TRINITY_DN6848_c0_g1_i1.p1 TRINITY_DN6848_c0_g1~~TRINITY_DN6848_c0_g1_i1.p1  ORF type:complete len:150 (-),score=13.24 TRINITY_DN6848_c0_g1_i1:54-503(-)